MPEGQTVPATGEKAITAAPAIADVDAVPGNLVVALALAGAGISVFPCQGWLDGDDAKRPCSNVRWRHESTTDKTRIAQWWARWPEAAPAIDVGKSNFLVIDCDAPKSDGQTHGDEWWQAQLAEHAPLAIPVSNTPSGGRHYLFRQPDGPPLGNARGSLPPKAEVAIDIRGSGGFVVAPGATFSDGRAYHGEGSLAAAPVAPDWLVELLSAKSSPPDVAPPTTLPPRPMVAPTSDRTRAWALAALDAEYREVASMMPGTRNEGLNKAAYKVGGLVGAGYLTMSEAFDMMRGAVVGWKDQPKTLDTLRRGLRDGAAAPRIMPPEEGHNGAALAALIMSDDGRTAADPETGEVFDLPSEGGAPGREQRQPWKVKPFIWTDPEAVPPRQWLYGRHLIRDFVSATIAPGGVGKSSLLLGEAVAMASGRDLFEQGLPAGALRVFVWQGEDPADEVTRRLVATCSLHGVSQHEAAGRLFVLSGRDAPITLATQGRDGVQIAKPMVADLIREIRENRIDVVIIDPFVSSHSVGENDNGAIDAVVKTWAAIAAATGCAVELVHHSRKLGGGEASVDDARGASALLAAVRAARTLNPMTKEAADGFGLPAEERFRWFRVDAGKANNAPGGGTSDWYRLESVELGNGDRIYRDGDSVGVVMSGDPRGAAIDPLMDLRDEEIHAIQDEVGFVGNWRRDERSPDWAGNAVLSVLGDKVRLPDGERDKRRIRTVLAALISAGFLRVEVAEDAHRKRRDFVRAGKLVDVDPPATHTPDRLPDGSRPWAGRRIADPEHGQDGVRQCSDTPPTQH